MKNMYLGATFIALFFLLGLFVTYDLLGIKALDKVVANLFGSFRTLSGLELMSNLTRIGEKSITFPVTGLFLFVIFFFRQWKMGTIFALSVWIIDWGTGYLKNLFAVERPYPLLGPAGGFSFPSGHVTHAAIVFFVIAFSLGMMIKDNYIRIVAQIACAMCILVVCISRLYLNVHWLSDVVGGVLLSVGVALVLYGAASLYEEKHAKKK
jgi:undecaprenyl-diphosphatase